MPFHACDQLQIQEGDVKHDEGNAINTGQQVQEGGDRGKGDLQQIQENIHL